VIEIVPADNKKNFREFLKFPFKIYGRETLWVPQLNKDIKEQFSSRNPFFANAEVMPFIARFNGEVAGRITAIHNRAHIEYSGEKAGFFGYFDCIDDSSVARALCDRVKDWLGQKGLSLMRGPMNFSSNEEWGVLIEGFNDPPMILMPYNQPYYEGLYEGMGLKKAKDLFAYIADVPDVFPDKVYRVERIAEKQGISVRPMNVKCFQDEMLIFKDLYNSSWEKNWGFMPMNEEEIEFTAQRLKPLIIPELALIAECNKRPVGFMMFLPDFNYVLKKLDGSLLPLGIFKALWHARKIKEARLLLLGIKEGFRRRGVDSLLFTEGLKGLKKKGFRRMEFSWVLEDNYAVQRIIETMQGRLNKKYRVYEGRIDQ
jgi:ribosomal protein S18 acetylase RimI-like enzyme